MSTFDPLCTFKYEKMCAQIEADTNLLILKGQLLQAEIAALEARMYDSLPPDIVELLKINPEALEAFDHALEAEQVLHDHVDSDGRRIFDRIGLFAEALVPAQIISGTNEVILLSPQPEAVGRIPDPYTCRAYGLEPADFIFQRSFPLLAIYPKTFDPSEVDPIN